MQDAPTSSAFSLESSSATLAEPRSDFIAPSYAVADAEPETFAQPVTQRERIPTIDVVRGVALMGILLMNIASFSGPLEMYVNPLMVGNHRTYNLIAWTLRWVLFEGKMRDRKSVV